jgi:tetratricopeptide (TPR) repeat protein
MRRACLHPVRLFPCCVQITICPRLLPLFLLVLIALLSGGPVRAQAGAANESEQKLQELAEAGRHRQAVAFGEAHLKDFGSSAKPFLLLADSCYEISDYEGTRRYALKALELEPADERAARLYVCSCRDQEQYTEGLKFGREWTTRNPDGSDIYKDLAMLAHDAGRLDEAVAFAAVAFKRKPENPRIAGVHFYYQSVTGDPLKAAVEAEAWAEKYKPDAFFWAQLGKGVSDAEKPAEALVYLRRALDAGSRDRGVPNEIMDCYRNLGDREAAAKFIAAYGVKHEIHADLWRTMGAIHYDAQAYGEALTAFEKAKKLDPSSPSTIANLIFTLIEVNRSREGIEEGQRWMNLELENATPGFHRAMGNAYYARGRWREAEPHYREAVRLDPKRIADVRELVVVLVKLNRAAEAVVYGRTWRAAHADIEDVGLEEQLAKAEQALSPSG